MIARSEPRAPTGDGPPLAPERDAAHLYGQTVTLPRGGSMQRCRILLVDDHPLLLEVLNRFLAEVSGIEIVARASDGLEAMSLAVVHRPDLVVTNLALPGLGGLELTRCLAAQPRAPRIVLMSFHDESEYRHAADAAGADGFILKQELGTKLVPMIQSLMEE